MANAKKKPSKALRRDAKSPGSVTMQIVGAKIGVRKVRFGAVTVSVGTLNRDVEGSNILQGQTALRRASKALAKPGVAFVRKKNVPYFHSDPKFPGHVVRVINGTKRSGVFDHSGVFKPASKTIAR